MEGARLGPGWGRWASCPLSLLYTHCSLTFILGLQNKPLPGWLGPFSSCPVCDQASVPVPVKCRAVRVQYYSFMNKL